MRRSEAARRARLDQGLIGERARKRDDSSDGSESGTLFGFLNVHDGQDATAASLSKGPRAMSLETTLFGGCRPPSARRRSSL